MDILKQITLYLIKPILSFCFISIRASAQNNMSDTIPFTINAQNTIFVKGIFNETDTLNLNFDTGTTELILINEVLNKKLKLKPKLYTNFYNLKIGNTNYQTKVYDAVLSGHGTDGRFGWDLFTNKIVEINYNQNIMVIHTKLPKHVAKNRKFTALKMSFYKDLFFVDAEIVQNSVSNKDLFLFDIGYQRTIMLDNDLLKSGNFPVEKMDTIKKVIMRGAQGNEIPVITSNLETFKIGKYTLNNVPVQLLTTNKPIRDKNTHILGNEVLKRFNVFLDFKSKIIYMKPNFLINENYIDQKKNI